MASPRIAAILLTSALAYAQPEAPPPPGRLVDMGGWHMHLHCTGERQPGKPSVILDAGAGDSSIEWSLVQPEVARFTRVCSYDRSGTGWSDLGPYPHTSRQIVFELSALLDRAGEQPPFVLVGHSIAGRYVKMFASSRPADIAGMVLIDANHEDDLLVINGQVKREWEGAMERPIPDPTLASPIKFTDLPEPAQRQVRAAAAREAAQPLEAPFTRLPAGAQTARKWMRSRPEWMAANNSDLTPEEVTILKKERQANPRLLGDKPLIVLTREEPSTGPQAAEREASRRLNQANLVTLSSRGKQIVVRDSSHHIHIDQPATVTAAIREVVGAAAP